MSSVYFITGTSGAGKTTLANALKSRLGAYVHDFDEGGVPEGADETWRRLRTDEWLKKAKEYRDKPTIICGVCVPDEIKQSKFYDDSFKVHYGLCYIDADTIRERLATRKWDTKEIEDNIVWAQTLERYVRAEKDYCIANSTKNNPGQVVEIVAKWINKFLE